MTRTGAKGFAAAALLTLCGWTYQATAENAYREAPPATPAIPATPADPATGVVPAIPATPAVPPGVSEEGISVGTFTAEYYHGDTLVASEQVKRPSINYSYSDFHDIPSTDFRAIWTGSIEMGQTPQILDINFAVHWSDVTLFIDGKQIADWSNSHRTIQHEFSPGAHEVKVEYRNNWHTTMFDTSFTTNTMYTKAEAKEYIEPAIDPDTQIIYVGSYESGDLYNDTTVTLDATANKVFLFLSSYDSLNWIIENPHRVSVTGIAYSSNSGVATVTADNAIPTFEVDGLAYGYETFSAPSDDITYLNGRSPDYSYGEYSLDHAVISVPGEQTDTDLETQIGPFTATYYDGDKFVASEEVDRPAINYAYSDFHGIPSSSFRATWTGTIEVFDEPEIIDLNFDVSWSDVSLFIDGEQTSSWSNGNRTITREFSPGVHEISIEYANNWHTTGFNTSFTTNTAYSKAEAKDLVAPYIDSDTRIVYVGAYESADLYNDTTVTIDSTADRVFLFLSSYDSLNWIIQNPGGVTITGIAYSSYSEVATVTINSAIPTLEIDGLAYGYADFSEPEADIGYLTGRSPDYSYADYALGDTTIEVP